MALGTTLSQAEFFDLLRVAPDGYEFETEPMQQRSLTGGGDRIVASRGPDLLKATLTTVPMPHAEAEGIMARLKSRGGGLKSFLLSNNRLLYPSSDPTGSIFGSATPVVGTITNRITVAFTGFPANYAIPVGTWFQIIFDVTSDAKRYYLGQFAEARTASSGGAVSAVEIWPPLPDSVQAGNAVTVKKPAARFLPIGGTEHISSMDALFSRVTFSAEQTYRKST